MGIVVGWRTKRGKREKSSPPQGKRARGLRAALLAMTVIAVVAVAASLLARAFGVLAAPQTRMHASRHTTVAAPAFASILSPDAYRHVACELPPQQPRMLTPAELAEPVLVGVSYNEDGNPRRCIVPGLAIPPAPGGAPDIAGQVILVSLREQWLWAYRDRTLMFATPVTTGREWLWTPTGDYHVQYKVQDTWFYSPWPPGSPYYYTPEHVDYALYFRDKGFFIHNAPWRHAFGPGTNVPHTSPDGTQEDGTHGCVNVTSAAGKWLYDWTQVGAAVIIVE